MKKRYLFFTFLVLMGFTHQNASFQRGENPQQNVKGKTLKIGGLEIAQFDFDTVMTFKEATKACAKLGNGWRLPLEQDFDYLRLIASTFGGFAHITYWGTSGVKSDLPRIVKIEGGTWGIGPEDESETYGVRAVRKL